MPKVVVVGAGQAAGTVARTWVEAGQPGSDLVLLTDEPVVSYERPALSKGYLTGAARLPGFHTTVGSGGERQDPAWYKDKGIDFRTSTRVTALDVAAKKVTLASGETLTYDKLILSTGAKPILLSDYKTPGADLQGVHYLRDEVQAGGLVKAIAETKEAGGQAVVIGGGYIGMEVAAGLAANGVPATIVFPEDRLLSRLLTPELAAFYEGIYESKGIKLVKGSLVTAVNGTDGKVSSVTIKAKDGDATQELPASLVVVGVGARPNVELVAGQLDLAPPPVGGIKVDEFLRTSNPDVYAVGDVAAFPLLKAGGQLARQEHVTHARLSAAQAVQGILGTATPYDYLPYFYSRVFNLSWQFWGSQGTPAAKIIHFGDVAAGKPGAYWVEGGKVIGVFLESASPEEAAAAKKLALDQPEAPTPVDSLATLGVGFASSRL